MLVAGSPEYVHRVEGAWAIESVGVSPVTSRVAGADETGRTREALPSRRELFALAAVLAATVLTAAAAIAGLTRSASPTPPSPPTVDQIIGPAPAAPPRVEPGD
jgi:hypothetical protein